jgi:hypothetical protein
VNLQRLLDDGADLHPGVERREGVLEDDLHVAPGLAHPLAIEGQDVLPVELHGS